MLLRDNKGGGEFELSIAGYESPYPGGNWLQVDVRMKGPNGERKKRDPCLTVEVAGELAGWLSDLARAYSKTSIGPGMPDLTEPNLRILVLKTSRSEVQLRVEFIFESMGNPPIFEHLDLAMERSDLESAVSDFRRELERWPVQENE